MEMAPEGSETEKLVIVVLEYCWAFGNGFYRTVNISSWITVYLVWLINMGTDWKELPFRL